MNKINKSRTYTSAGRPTEIYRTDGGGLYPVHGAIQGAEGNWYMESWTAEGIIDIAHPETGANLTEALKPNGIPVGMPDPPEVEGYTWEARGWGWKSDEEAMMES